MKLVGREVGVNLEEVREGEKPWSNKLYKISKNKSNILIFIQKETCTVKLTKMN